MQTPFNQHRPVIRSGLALALLLAVDASAWAQSTPTPAKPTNNASNDEALVLSPFEVRTQKDTSYGALNSGSITMFNMELLKTPVAVDIMTQQFMDDVSATTVEDLLSSYSGGPGTIVATPDSDSNNNQPGDRFSVSQGGTRGLSTGQTHRDGFLASSTATSLTDSFDVERVETVKGANALLYGASGAGGITNLVTKSAKFGHAGQANTDASVQLRIDAYGSKRRILDANYGLENIAARFVLLNQELSYRRLFIGARTNGIYGTMSFKLPLHTTMRITGRWTDNDRVIPTREDHLTGLGSSSSAGPGIDPRYNESLLYLLATNQVGAINPATGQPFTGTAVDPSTGQKYQLGALLNGNVSWNNASSLTGWEQSEDITAHTFTASFETTWTKWLATSFSTMYDDSVTQRGPDGGTFYAPNHFNPNNPLNDWAMGATFRMDRSASRQFGYRGDAVITNNLFSDRAHSQTVFGYDLSISNGGNTNYRYFAADSNGNIYTAANPAPAGFTTAGGTKAADALGRYVLGTVYWPIGNGPIAKPGWRIGSRQISLGGQNYVLTQMNPRDPSYVNAANPLGLASLSGNPGFLTDSNLKSSNFSNYDGTRQQLWGAYGANYTKWFDDKLTTLVGYRWSYAFSRDANSSTASDALLQPAYNDVSKSNGSFNLGASYRLKQWLYTYYNAGQTFYPVRGSRDPLGVTPQDQKGFSQEIGFKFSPMDGKISGSIAYYWGYDKNENYNYGTTIRDLINPVGLNDAYNPSQRNQWISLDQQSKGVELILTASPTQNWRIRLGMTEQAGTIKTDRTYQFQWNDQFYVTGGGVTYADGTPFMVPVATDTANITKINALKSAASPVLGSSNVQLTLGMMNSQFQSDGVTPNPYFLWSTTTNSSGQPVVSYTSNGSMPTTSATYKALHWFQTKNGAGANQQALTGKTGLPVSAIPYYWPDPQKYGGSYTVSKSGDPTIGYPKYRFILTNSYDFTHGALKGLTLGGTIRWDFNHTDYWYFEPNSNGGTDRKLHREPDVNPQFDPFIRYSRKFRRVTLVTQFNIYNMFNRYKIDLRPSETTGFSNVQNIGATFVGEPRQFAWTNTLKF